tara:strand:+ start:346 stop:549 length:204 start_codon:yes stop_codon:yes gene_type:complete
MSLEFEVIMSPLLANKIDEMFKSLSSNLEEIRKKMEKLSNKIESLEHVVENIQTTVPIPDYLWSTST